MFHAANAEIPQRAQRFFLCVLCVKVIYFLLREKINQDFLIPMLPLTNVPSESQTGDLGISSFFAFFLIIPYSMAKVDIHPMGQHIRGV